MQNRLFMVLNRKILWFNNKSVLIPGQPAI